MQLLQYNIIWLNSVWCVLGLFLPLKQIYLSGQPLNVSISLKAGIPGTQLILAYEPEAAAIYCRESTYQRKGQLVGPISAFSTEESILVLDCGGWY